MSKLLTYISAIGVSFIPLRYRWWWPLESTADFRNATILSGILQALLIALALTSRFMTQFPEFVAEVGMMYLDNSTGPIDRTTVTRGAGLIGISTFIIQPLNMLMAYFVIEGAFRSIAALVSHETFGTLPLQLVAWTHGLIETTQRRHLLQPILIDEIQPGDGETHHVRVLSCRPKPEWNPYITVRFRSEFYMLAGEEAGPKPRPFIYRLRKNPANRAVVVIREYSLDDVITKPPYQGV